jgi:hypothetical protein
VSWKVHERNDRPGSALRQSREGDYVYRQPGKRQHCVNRFRQFIYPLAASAVLGFPPCVISGAAMAVPIPSASTASELNVAVSISGAQLQSALYTITGTATQTATAATGLDPLGGQSGHFATADGSSYIQSIERITAGPGFSFSSPILNIGMQHQTLAESLWSGPMGARASAVGSAAARDLTLTAAPGATLTLAWNFEELRLGTTPLASLSTMQHMVSVTLLPLSGEMNRPAIFQAGFGAASRDGETRWKAFDFPGSTAISDWLAALLGQDNKLPGGPIKGPTLTLPLAGNGSSLPDGTQELNLAIELSHREFSTEAPLAPVSPVGERAGSEETGAMAYWNAGKRQLSFDQLPVNLLLDAGGASISGDNGTDPLFNAYLEIDPLVYIGEFDRDGYFEGTGNVRLISHDGAILFEAPLSGLGYDQRLYDLEGFNLFGPLLGATQIAAGDSHWLTAFYQRMNGKKFYLPELFLDIGPSMQQALPGGRWDSDFSAPANAALSFAGPQVVSLPGSATLVLIGLLLLHMPRIGSRRTSITGGIS